MKRMMNRLVLAFLVMGPLTAQLGSSGWVRPGGVLFGNPDFCRKPAKVQVAKVFNVIPEIIKIRRENPAEGERDILKERAKQRFKRVLRLVARAGRFDCVVMDNQVIGKPPHKLVDITSKMLQKITK